MTKRTTRKTTRTKITWSGTSSWLTKDSTNRRRTAKISSGNSSSGNQLARSRPSNNRNNNNNNNNNNSRSLRFIRIKSERSLNTRDCHELNKTYSMVACPQRLTNLERPIVIW